MSKSKGKIYTISELQKRGFDPLAYRYLTLQTNYRKQALFSWENLENAQNAYKRVKKIIFSLKDDKKKVNKKYLDEFVKAINDDLDMPKALALAWKLLDDKKLLNKQKLEILRNFDKIFGWNDATFSVQYPDQTLIKRDFVRLCGLHHWLKGKHHMFIRQRLVHHIERVAVLRRYHHREWI